jgi:hypothetical protein
MRSPSQQRPTEGVAWVIRSPQRGQTKPQYSPWRPGGPSSACSARRRRRACYAVPRRADLAGRLGSLDVSEGLLVAAPPILCVCGDWLAVHQAVQDESADEPVRSESERAREHARSGPLLPRKCRDAEQRARFGQWQRLALHSCTTPLPLRRSARNRYVFSGNHPSPPDFQAAQAARGHQALHLARAQPERVSGVLDAVRLGREATPGLREVFVDKLADALSICSAILSSSAPKTSEVGSRRVIARQCGSPPTAKKGAFPAPAKTRNPLPRSPGVAGARQR